MPTTVVQEIEQATRQVFASMVGVDVVPDSSEPKVGYDGKVNLVSTLRLSGSVNGVARVRYTLPLATCITCRMLEVDPPLGAEAILDAVGEIANMIVGNLKSSLENRWGSIRIGTPMVGTAADTPVQSGSLAVHFRWKQEIFSVSVAFQPSLDDRGEGWGS